ncbi:MAG TPA: hypothetical protein VGY99_06890 [Candidatus Binataceae bacterium]|jgi:drug/metabolite transporter (DMT)-like permease|nr:hypothetical protein [Candidatus Binataceae bacterium]
MCASWWLTWWRTGQHHFFGGILGPILMLFGLRHLSAVAGSLLLNLEGPFTALIAIGLLREHLPISGKSLLVSCASRESSGYA